MVSKKGVARIIEAVLAIMLILGALLLISSNKEVEVAPDITQQISPMMDKMAQNKTMRYAILDYNLSANYSEHDNPAILKKVEDFMRKEIANPSFNLNARVCRLNETCFLDPLPNNQADLYAVERVIGTEVKEPSFLPRRVKIFLWRK
jgi:hypothetical protein